MATVSRSPAWDIDMHAKGVVRLLVRGNTSLSSAIGCALPCIANSSQQGLLPGSTVPMTTAAVPINPAIQAHAAR